MYQRIVKWAGWILAGILAFGALLDAFGNAISLVTRTVAITGSVIIVVAWLLVEFVVKRYSLPWRGVDGTEQRLKTLGPQPRLFVVGILILLWIPSFIEWTRGKDVAPKQEVARHDAPTPPTEPKQKTPLSPELKGASPPKPANAADLRKQDPPGPKLADIALNVTHAGNPSITVFNNGKELLREPRYSLALFDLDRATWEKGILPTLRTNTPTFTTSAWLRPGNGFGGYPIFESNKPTPGTRIFGWARCDCPTCAREKFYLIYLVFEQEGWYYEIPEGRSVNMEFFKAVFGKTKNEQEALLHSAIPASDRKQLAVP